MRIPLGVLLLAVLLVPAACAAPPVGNAGPGVQASADGTVDEAASAPAPAPAPAAQGTAETSKAAPSAPPTTQAAAAAARCRASQLGDVRRTKGRTFGGPVVSADVVLTNVSESACFVSGWVGLAFVGSTTRTACVAGQPQEGCGGLVDTTSLVRGPRVQHLAGSSDAVVVRPGAGVAFSMVFSTDDCFEQPYRVRIRIPEGDGELTLEDPGICLSQDFSVTPLGSTAG
ncbi:MAG: hypothetical protein PGN15_09355 [Aeromicrobium erythreum]